MNARDFHSIYQELIEENPLAIRAVLKVLHVEFTDEVPTLAVTCEDRPRLLVNLGFVREHCRTEAHVKAVVCHEFLHVLLRHTERFTTLTPAEHLALDAVINAMWIAPEIRGRGYGKQLCEACIAWATQHAYPRIYLHAKRDNAAALATYRAVGFEPVGTEGDELVLTRTLG